MKKHFNMTTFVLIASAVCLFAPALGLPGGVNTGKNSPDVISASKNTWGELLKRKPYPHTIPLASKPTIVDGTYVKKAKKEGEIIPCRRCPDWLPYPGIWKLNLAKGSYRIYHEDTGWRSIGTYILADNRILFANDPCCINHVGMYLWKIENNKIIFKMIDDDCAIKLRALNLMEVPWESCQPPNTEAATTGHWQKPNGCD